MARIPSDNVIREALALIRPEYHDQFRRFVRGEEVDDPVFKTYLNSDNDAIEALDFVLETHPHRRTIEEIFNLRNQEDDEDSSSNPDL